MCRLVWEGGGSLNGQRAMNELDLFLKRKSDPSVCFLPRVRKSAALVISHSRGSLCGVGTAGCPPQSFLSDHTRLGFHRDASEESPESEKVLVQTLEFA